MIARRDRTRRDPRAGDAMTAASIVSRRRLLAWAAVLAVVAAAGCAKSRAIRKASNPPDVAFRKITIRGWSASGLEWELSADQVEVGSGRRVTVMKDLRRAALMRGGKPEVEVSARQVRVDNETHDLELAGGVTLRTAAGLEVKAAALRWIARLDRLQSDGPAQMRLGEARLDTPLAIYDAVGKRLVCPRGIRVVSPASTLRADRLVAEVETRELRLAGDVRMRMRVQDFETALAGEAGRKSPLQQLTPLLGLPRGRHG